MSDFTIQLRHLLTAGYTPTLTEYPIFSESYRTHLNNAIIDHYKFREIGLETPDLFDHYLRIRMNEIMPKYNKLYLSDLLEFNPLFNVNLTETTNRENSGVASSANSGNNTANTVFSNGKSKRTNIESDTPGGNVDIANVENGGFASKITVDQTDEDDDTTNVTADNQNSSASESASVEQFLKNISGANNVNQSELLLKYRQTLINIDLMVINELSDLFMGVYEW